MSNGPYSNMCTSWAYPSTQQKCPITLCYLALQIGNPNVLIALWKRLEEQSKEHCVTTSSRTNYIWAQDVSSTFGTSLTKVRETESLVSKSYSRLLPDFKIEIPHFS